MTIEICTVPHGSLQYYQTVDLRRRILRAPLGLDFSPERLAREADEIHLSAWDGDTVVGCVVLRPPKDNHPAELGQMAVDPEKHRQGIGAKLVRELEAIAVAYGWQEIVLKARQAAIPFYTALGYCGEGDLYSEPEMAGLWYLLMRKLLESDLVWTNDVESSRAHQ